MFTKNINIRIKFIFYLFSLLFFVVIVRVFYIQVFDYKKLFNLADNLWSRDLNIEADRGRILDRKGRVLADNLTTTSLIIIPSQVTNKELVINSLSEILGVDKSVISKYVNKKSSIERVHPEGRRLSYEISSKISDLKLDGVYLIREAKRYYPYGKFLSHTLGYVGIDNQGLSGIELMYDKYLTGENGKIKYYADAHGKRLNKSDVYIAPSRGMDVNLTIDLDIQKSLEREMENINSMFNPDMALGIVINPKSGELLGISSLPSFDPNNYKDYDKSILNRNLPIWASYEPGSTFKVVTMASAINEGVVDIFNDHFYDSGKVNVDGSILKCWKSKGHGDETFLQVLENSCNLGVYTRTLISL